MVHPGFSDLEDSAFIPGGARWGTGGVQGPDEEPGEEGCPPPSRLERGDAGPRAGGWWSAGEGRWAGVAPWVRAREGAGSGAREVAAARLGRCRSEDTRGALGGGAQSPGRGRGRSQEPFHGCRPPLSGKAAFRPAAARGRLEAARRLREPPPWPRPAPPPAAGWGSAGRGARGGARAELRPLRTCRARAPASTGRS